MEVTVNPLAIPDIMSTAQKEAWLLFGILVCGKEASSTHKKLNDLLSRMVGTTPFAQVRASIAEGSLLTHLREVRTGQYTRILRAFSEVVSLDADRFTLEDLESVHGVGPKTARMTMLYCEPNQEVVPLDTHVLKYLKKLGYAGVPNSTPANGKVYRRLEAIFIEEAHKASMSVREFDTYVWRMFSKALNG